MLPGFEKKNLHLSETFSTLVGQCFDVLIPGLRRGLEDVVEPTITAVRALYSTFFEDVAPTITIPEQFQNSLNEMFRRVSNLVSPEAEKSSFQFWRTDELQFLREMNGYVKNVRRRKNE